MVPTVVALDNPVQDYAWGSRTAIADFLGRPNPSQGPEAELWIGAHPKAPSRVLGSGPDGTLDVLIRRDPAAALGPDVARRFSGQLPFLLKIIAAAEPLSIQCHPNLEQAVAGFERENRAAIPLGAPRRNYRDPNHKPELAFALTRLVALKGFRPIADVVAALRPLGLSEVAGPLDALAKEPSAASLGSLFSTLLCMDEASRVPMVSRAMTTAAQRKPHDPATELALQLQARHPGDVGVLAPFLLNMLELQPEEGLFLGPGELHAYIEGTAVEVMANSDNVLRGGLTSKHVDVRELLRVATFASGPPEILRPEGVGPGERVYRTPACEFELALVDVSRETGPWSRPRRGPELLLGLDGEATLVTPDQSHSLARGRSLFVPAAVADYRIDGSGRVCRASVPA